MENTVNKKIKGYINKAIDYELNFEPDRLTGEGVMFLKTEASDLVMKAILKDKPNKEELKSLTYKEVDGYLGIVIHQYERLNNQIRSYW